MSGKTQNLYKVSIKDEFSSFQPNYHEVSVIAEDPTEAYNKYRNFLDREDISFEKNRVLEKVELIAEASRYPDSSKFLFM